MTVWLYRKARTQALDLMQHQKPSGAWTQLSMVAQSSIKQVGEPTQQSRQVDSILQKMPAEQRQCVEFAYFEGMSQSQIAIFTKLPLDMIKSHLRVGIETLEECLSASDSQKFIRLHDNTKRE